MIFGDKKWNVKDWLCSDIDMLIVLFPDEAMIAIKSELESRETLCSSSLAMKHFYHDCFDDDCKLDLTRIEDTSARCTYV
jgi:hypothetical protein